MASESETRTETGLPALRLSLRQHARLQASVDRTLASTDYTLSEAKVLVELLIYPGQTHRQLATALGMPTSQVSRAAKPLERKGLLRSEPAKKRNQRLLILTELGTEAAQDVDAAIDDALNAEYKRLDAEEQTNLHILWRVSNANPNWLNDKSKVKLRPLALDDLSWLVEEMGQAAKRLRYREAFLVDVIDLVARYLRQPSYNRPSPLAIAHIGPSCLGVCLLRHDEDDIQARIELLYVAPSARRMGVGEMLLKQAIKEAKDMTFSRVTVSAAESWPALDMFLRQFGFDRSRETREVFSHYCLERHRDYSFEIGF